jgi:hypothetical protein
VSEPYASDWIASWAPSNDLPPVPPAPVAREPDEPYDPGPGPGGDPHEPPKVELRPCTREELYQLFRGGEHPADELEGRLVKGSRARGGLWLRIGQGLRALLKGRRHQELAFRFPDYCRELKIGRSRGYALAAFAEALETRPLLLKAVETGRVKYRAAQVVMELAVGEAEAYWVEKAATLTVRALEEEVKRLTDPHFEEPWFRKLTAIEPGERELLETAMELAGRLDPHASACGRYEALAMEYLGEFPEEAEDVPRPSTPGPQSGPYAQGVRDLWDRGFHRIGLRAELAEKRAAAMEGENERWSHMPCAADMAAPEIDFASMTSAKEIDREIRRLVRQDNGWDEIMGHAAHTLQASRLFGTLGYASFKQYVEERLGLPYRWVSERAQLEEKIWASPGLQEARRQKVGFEKLKLLSTLPETEIKPWIGRAKALTVIDLRRRIEVAEDVRMRGQGRMKAILPRSVAYLLAAAIETARARASRPIADGEALAIISAHFISTYEGVLKRRRTNSQRVRDRDGGWCTVPGCSAHSDDAHHIEFRSQGGHPTALWNQTGGCRFHHVCVHEFGLRLEGKAPDALVWTLDGAPFTGR